MPPVSIFEVPEFTISGVLPPYFGSTPIISAFMSPFPTTLVRIATKLCTSDERKTIFKGFIQYRQELAQIGLTNGFHWLSGSFLEDKEGLCGKPPNDIDIVTFCHRPSSISNDDQWEEFNNVNIELLHPMMVKERYKCDAYFVDLNTDPSNIVNQARYWFGLFSHQRVTGLWKGLLQVPLAVSQDDADASLIVGQ